MLAKPNRHISIVLLLLAAASASFADVAPDPGYTRVSANLVLETDADISGFRFFLESPSGIEEVKVETGGPTKIDAAGRGGAARYAKLIAVPVADIASVGLKEIEQALKQKKYAGARELLSHNFQATIPEWEKSGWSDPVFRISVEGGKISATPIAGGRPSGTKLTYSVWQFAWPVAVGGVLLAIAMAVTGLWLLRRREKVV